MGRIGDCNRIHSSVSSRVTKVDDRQRLRIAFFTPLDPQRTGISDYSEELLPYLQPSADIDLVLDGYRPTSNWEGKGFGVISASDFRASGKTYDVVVYQIGNNLAYHGYMVPFLRDIPGVVVLHDYSLSYLMLGLTLLQGDFRSLKDMLRPDYGADCGHIAIQLLFNRIDHYAVEVARPIVEMSRGIIVHNEYAGRILAGKFPGTRIRVIRHATPIRPLRDDVRELRTRYGLSPDGPIVASVSTLSYNKRLGLVLGAVRDVQAKFPGLKFLLVGQGNLGAQARRLIADYGLRDTVLQTGWLPPEAYLDHIAMADVVVDLRYPSAGETSGSSLRALQASKPLVVSAHGSFLEFPDDCVIKVPLGDGEQVRLAQELVQLLSRPEKRESFGAAARRYAETCLRREDAARLYLEFLHEIVDTQSAPVRRWSFPPPEKKSFAAWPVGQLYRFCRMLSYVRQYGPGATVRRALRGS